MVRLATIETSAAPIAPQTAAAPPPPGVGRSLARSSRKAAMVLFLVMTRHPQNLYQVCLQMTLASCPALSRASTFPAFWLDGRVEPGHDAGVTYGPLFESRCYAW